MRFTHWIIILVTSMATMACSGSSDLSQEQLPQPPAVETVDSLFELSIIGGYIQFGLNDPEAAVPYYEKENDLWPTSALDNLYDLYLRKGDYNNAYKTALLFTKVQNKECDEYPITELCNNTSLMNLVRINADKTSELYNLDEAENALLTLSHPQDLDAKIYLSQFYQCKKSNKVKADFWREEALKLLTKTNTSVDYLYELQKDCAVFDMLMFEKTSYESFAAIADYLHYIDQDYPQAISYYKKSYDYHQSAYVVEKQLEAYLNMPIQQQNQDQILSLIEKIKTQNEKRCPDYNNWENCAGQSHHRYLASFYLDPNNSLYDINKGEAVLLKDAKRKSRWAISELVYLYKCTKPDQMFFDYWFKIRFPNGYNKEITCAQSVPSILEYRY